jgi:GNAT superfamily N-acetyltransferase
MDVRIRSGTIADAVSLAPLLIAEAAAAPLGFALVTRHEARLLPIFVPRRWAEVEVLVVAAARGGGVGRALMVAAHDWAADQGIARVQVVVWEANAGARRFYERLGYTTSRRTMWRDLD